MEKKLPEIIRAEEKDKEQVKSVLKLGFSNDDLLRWVFPSANSFLKSFDLWMEEFSKESFKNNIVFSEKNFHGTSLWHPPGFEFDDTVLHSTFESIPDNRLEDALKFFEEFSEYHPKDAWYLAFIAVDPSKQGSGIGSFILKEALRMIDEKKERAYLEASSERNMSLYERHGFECIGKIQINDSPPAFPMIREGKN